ncbi:hypothetical protein ACA910_001624 [Epithemia clementina (nom. ined.)]
MSTEIGALSHLVEAATALANLDRTAVECDKEEKMKSVANESFDNKPKQASKCDAGPNKSKREIFPQRLLAVLNDDSLSDIISWLPHGKSFVIIRPDVFTEKVMPNYFPPVDARGSTKYPSFTRKLNRWGFRQATRGPDTGAFHHPFFQRDRPELCVDMVCQRSRGSSNTVSKNRASNLPQQTQTELPQSPVNVAPLTKESIEKILPTPQTGFLQTVATVSVDETRSVTSTTSSSSQLSPSSHSVANAMKRGISNDKEFVDLTIRQRDEMERMRIAQALLYKAFTSALQDQDQPLGK